MKWPAFFVPGAFILGALLTPCDAVTIQNPSFEAWNVLGQPSGWVAATSGAFSVTTKFDAVNGLPTDGRAFGLIYRGGGVSNGDAGFLWQFVDLTGITSITFDASLERFDQVLTNSWSSALEARFMIDGIVFWSRSVHGSYFDQVVDTSSLPGTHMIAFENLAVSESGLLPGSDWFMVDNIRVTSVPEPSGGVLLLLGAIIGITKRIQQKNRTSRRS